MSSTGADITQKSMEQDGAGWITGLAMLGQSAVTTIGTMGKKLYDLYNMGQEIEENNGRRHHNNGQKNLRQKKGQGKFGKMDFSKKHEQRNSRQKNRQGNFGRNDGQRNYGRNNGQIRNLRQNNGQGNSGKKNRQRNLRQKNREENLVQNNGQGNLGQNNDQGNFCQNNGEGIFSQNNGQGNLGQNNSRLCAPPHQHSLSLDEDKAQLVVKDNSEKKDRDQETLEKENEDATFGVSQCIVCLYSVRQVILEPCGHVCLCSDCAVEIKRRPRGSCPICREYIRGIKLCYLS